MFSHQMHWSAEEKRLLEKLVAINTNSKQRVDWSKVASGFENRTKNQCKTQFQLVLHPVREQLNHAWTDDEKHTILAAVRFYGTKWTLIQE